MERCHGQAAMVCADHFNLWWGIKQLIPLLKPTNEFFLCENSMCDQCQYLGSDIKIFNSALHHYLEPGERVEVDNAYVGHADKIKCPYNTCDPEENLAMQAHVRSQHETLNRRLKNWGIPAQVSRHNIVAHGMVFHACAVVTQLSIANGEPLFEVEYGE